ncbi:MAG: fructose-6-phosphate aldolase [Nitrospinae bacterium RIFCSPLOWO2_12_FULL_45_22]|nr:MAG: fructose-6-phosphate aldolase [Nitrospinae bacterium RIFCSPLOWO2_12_FULL_45_22]
MKFFIDTANVNEIREAYSWGVIDGVTTNPSLIAKEGREFQELVQEICSIVDGPISVEAISMEVEGIVKEARALAEISRNVVIKVPMTIEGLKATKRLKQDNIATNMTLAFSPTQALVAAKAGASYISPFVGRLDDISHVGMEVVEKIIAIYSNYDFPTEVIVASVRHPLHVVEAALMGAHIATIPFKVIEQIVKHPLTDIGIERFLADWKKVPK